MLPSSQILPRTTNSNVRTRDLCSPSRCRPLPVSRFMMDRHSKSMSRLKRGECSETDTRLTRGKQRIPIEFMHDRSRRYSTFSKRKTGLMKKAYELAELTKAEVLLLVASETKHVYTFATARLKQIIESEEGKAMIQACLSGDSIVSSSTGVASSMCFESGLEADLMEDDEELEDLDDIEYLKREREALKCSLDSKADASHSNTSGRSLSSDSAADEQESWSALESIPNAATSVESPSSQASPAQIQCAYSSANEHISSSLDPILKMNPTPTSGPSSSILLQVVTQATLPPDSISPLKSPVGHCSHLIPTPACLPQAAIPSMSSLGPFTCLADSDNSPLERGIPLNSGSLMTSAPQHVSVLPSTPTSVKIISTPLTNSAQLPQTQHITVCGTSLSDTNVPVVSAGDTDSGLCTLAQPRVNSIPLLSLSPSLFGQLLSSLIPQPDQPNPELVATSIASSTHTSLFPGYLPTSCLHQAATTANAIPASSGTAIIVSNPALPGQTPSPSDVTNAPHDAMAMTTRQLVWQAARHDGLTTTSIPTNSIRPLTHAPAQIMNSKVSAKVADSQPVLKLPPNSLVLLVDGTNVSQTKS